MSFAYFMRCGGVTKNTAFGFSAYLHIVPMIAFVFTVVNSPCFWKSRIFCCSNVVLAFK